MYIYWKITNFYVGRVLTKESSIIGCIIQDTSIYQDYEGVKYRSERSETVPLFRDHV